MPGHVPVLLPAVLDGLHLQSNDDAIDATLGGGGHTRAILDAVAPRGRVLGLEADARTLSSTRSTLSDPRAMLVHANYRNLRAVAVERGFSSVAATIFDLGLSSIALDDPDRGFSFQQDGPLDMRLDPTAQTVKAADIVRTESAAELERIFRDYGSEPRARSIAAAIVAERRQFALDTTGALAQLIARVKPRRGRLHPATQVFQALRMVVNDELGSLQAALPQAVTLLRAGGRLAVITFHSGEDRLVKRWGQAAARDGQVAIITKHVIAPLRAEILANPRARSAKLRLYQKN